MRGKLPLLAFLAASCLTLPLIAAPALRYQTDVRGGFILVGNSLGWDCSTTANPNIPPPIVGAVGACNSNITDTAIDVLWRSDSPANGNAQSSVSITAATARSSANLTLPNNANIVYARLYWSAENSTAAVGTTITFEKPSVGWGATLTADGNQAVTFVNGANYYMYQSTVDVTPYVQKYGPGVYRAGNIAVKDPTNQLDETSYAAWAMVVVYQDAAEVLRNVTLFDGLDIVSANANNFTTSITGFYVPQQAGYDGKFAIVAYEGDASISGDQFYFNSQLQSNAINPNNNFFNGTRSYFGTPQSDPNDLPQLSGDVGSMTGVDVDVVDVTSLLRPGDTNATLRGTSTQDAYFLGVMSVAISTFKPDFTNTTKTYTNMSESNGTRPGDVLEYTISFSNTGTDTATNVAVIDSLPTSVTYIPGSTRITSGYNTGAKTDAAGDDQAEYTSNPNRLTIRVGSGASATSGGNITTSDPATVIKFQVTVNAGASGSISNQASISSKGQKAAMQGIGAVSYNSGNGSAPNAATTAPLDACAINSDCTTAAAPHCNTSVSPHACAGCVASSECANYTATPVCKSSSNSCVACLSSADCVGNANCVSNACVLAGAVVITSPSSGSTVGNTPKISGTAPPNATVEVTVGGSVVGTVPANSSGAWTYQSAMLAAGTYATTARAISANGATASSASVSFTVRGCSILAACTAPDTCTNAGNGNCVECTAATSCAQNANCINNVCTFAAPTVTAPANNSATHAQKPPMGGTAPGNSTVTVVVDGSNIGTTTASASGAWSLTPTNNLTVGTHTVKVLASAGNANTYASSPYSNTNTFSVTTGCVNDGECSGGTPACRASDHTCVRCTAAANCPSGTTCAADNSCFVAAPTVSSPSNSSIAFTSTPQISGTAPKNAAVVVYEDGNWVGTTTASSTGTWTLASAALSDGFHTVYAVAQFGSGTSTASSNASGTNAFRVINGGCTSGANCGGSTPQCNTVTNTCVVCLTNNDCSAPMVCNTSSNACVRCTSDSDCPTGATCGSNACVVPAPVVSAPANGSVTNVSPTAVTGSATAGASVVVTLDGTAGMAVTADANGRWTYPVSMSLSYGNHTVQAKAIVGSGSAAVSSAVSNVNTFKVGCLSNADCSNPTVCNTATAACVRCNTGADCPSGATCSGNSCGLAAPVVSMPANGATTNRTSPTITGTSVANANIVVTIDSSAGTAKADSSGNWSYTPTASFALSSHSVSATASLGSGAAQVTSGSSNVNTFTIISGCISNSDCSGGTPVCRTSDHLCVGCIVNSDCGGSTPVCDPTSYVCEGCATSADCSGSTPVCNPTGHACAACVSTSDCPAGAVCGGNSCSLASPVINSPANAQVINNRRPSISGTAKPNAQVALSIDGTVTNVAADANGSWSYTPASNLTYATHNLSATATVGTGATAVTSAATTSSFQVVNGCVAHSDCPNPSQPLCNTTSHACVACLANSDCAATPSTPTCDSAGTHTCVGCVSSANCATGATCSNNVCSLAPPNILVPANNAVTNNTSPAINGNVVAAGAKVVVTLDGTAGASVTADGSGNWTYSPVSTLAYGSHTVTAVASVTSGGTPATSAASAAVTFTVGCLGNSDCTAVASALVCDTGTHACVRCASSTDCPEAATCASSSCVLAQPVITTPAQGSQTANTKPAISGTSVANANMLVSIDSGTGTVVKADGSGNWSFTPTTAISLGDHNILATATVGQGALAVSANSNIISFRVTVACTSDANCTTPSLPVCDTSIGKCVQCTSNAACANNGNNKVCNTTSQSCVECVASTDCTSPAACSSNACTLPVPSVTQPANGSTINTPTPLFVGTGIGGATIVVTLDGSVQGATTTVNPNGSWSLNASSSLAAGAHTVTAVAKAGAAISAASSPVTFNLVIGCLANSDCVGTPSTPVCNISSHACVGCTSSSQCGTRQCDPTQQKCVDCLSDGDCSPSAPACSSNACVRCTANSYCPTPATCSAPSCMLTIPSVTAPTNNGLVNNPNTVIKGAADSNVTVLVTLDGNAAVAVSADANGNWAFIPPTPLPAGQHTVSAVATAGTSPAAVSSSASAVTNFHLVTGCLSNADCPSPSASLCDAASRSCVGCLSSSDCSTPTGKCDTGGTHACVNCVTTNDCPAGAVCGSSTCSLASPVLATPANGSTLNTHAPTLRGTAVANSDVWVYVDNGLVGHAAADANGNWSFVMTTTLGDGGHSAYAMASVGSGSATVTSAASGSNNFTIVSGCVSDADCGGGQPHCKASGHTCVACLSNSDCSYLAPTCDTAHNACVGCLSNSDCPASVPNCDTAAQQCVRCLSSSDCPSPASCSMGACTLAAPAIAQPVDRSTLNNPQPTVSGTSAANANIVLTLDGNALPPFAATGTSWSITLAKALSSGSHTLTAVAVLGSGATAVTSPASSTVSFTLVSGCLADSDCLGSTPHCLNPNHLCVACIDSSQCTTGQANVCDPNHACVQCQQNSDCVYDPNKTQCDPASAICAQCLTDAVCPANLPRCDTHGSWTCVRCFADSDCPSGASCKSLQCQVPTPRITTPAAEAYVSTSVSFSGTSAVQGANIIVLIDGITQPPVTVDANGRWTVSPATAPPSGVHILAAYAMLGIAPNTAQSPVTANQNFTVVGACASAKDCGGSTPLCRASDSTCVGCIDNTSCTAPKGVCDPSTSQCVGCVASSDCSTPQAPVCDTTVDTCVGCLDSSQCSAPMAACDTMQQVCVQCLGDQDCSGATPACDPASNTCVGCATSADCSAPKPVCNSANEQCVGCLSNLDCGGSTPVCELLSQLCVGCQSDGDCGSPTPKCAGGAQACVRCVATGDCPVGATCGSDMNCLLAAPAVTYPADGSRINDPSPLIAGSTVPGASISVSLDDVDLGTVTADNSTGAWSFQIPQSLGTGQHDVEVTATAGSGALAVTSATTINLFIVASNCATDADCGGVTPLCDTGSGMCVECNSNKDCPAGAPVCDTINHNCQLCNDGYGSNASAACPSATQPVCAHTGACFACTSAADCIGSSDGDVCNTVTGSCGTGCTVDVDCGPSGYCQSSACTSKLANGSPLPAGSLPCSAIGGQRVCSSGVCDAGLNTCGHVNGQGCTSAAQCSSGVCDTDGRCGAGNGSTCSTSGTCRSGTCASDGLCGLPDNALCRSTPECRGVCFPDGRCGLGAAIACVAAADCRSGVCAGDGNCGAPLGAACTNGGTCRSSACHGGVCAAQCAADADCDSVTHCDAGTCVANAEPTACAVTSDCWPGKGCSGRQCVALSAAGAPCAQASDCASGVCASDGACGLPEAFPCGDPQSCRSGICSADGLCATACARDAECANTQFCDQGTQSCQPLEDNGLACARDAQCTAYVCSVIGVCGQVNSAACGSDSACQSNICADDAQCGKPNDASCAEAAECRSSNCSAGSCKACQSDTDCSYGKCDVGTGTCSIKIDSAKYRFAGTGWGCNASQPAYAAVLTMLWCLRRRRRSGGSAGLLLVLLLASVPAHAANHRFTLERYNTTAIGETSLWVDRPWYTPNLDILTVGLSFDYAHDPLRVDYVKGGTTLQSFGLIQHELVGRLEVAAGFLDRVNLSISLPMVLLDRGVSLMGITPLHKPAFSDPSVAAVGRILGDRTHDAFSLHVGVEVWVPLANTMTASDGSVRVLPKLIAGGMLSDDWDYAATVGFLVRQSASIGLLPLGPGNSVGNEIQVGIASSWYTPDRAFSVGPEAVYANEVASGNSFFNSLEVMLGAHYLPVDALRLSAGVGTGFFGMPGTPRLRGFLRIAYTPPLQPSSLPPDRDGDGVPDATDACPTVAGSVWSANPNDAGCVVDHDHDGVADAQDVCPDQAPEPRQDPNRLGCPMLDSDQDGVYDPEDLCPTEAQGPHPHPQKPGCPDPDSDNDGVYDSADQCKNESAGPFPDVKLPGCPLRDRDGDTVPDAVDACPDKPGAPSPKPEENGCPGLVQVKGNQIVILEQVNFVSGKDIIVPKSNNVLEAVKDVLVVRPDVQRISIEGHTDNMGKPKANLLLSEKRAAAVRRWLMQHGIEGTRLEFQGFGDTQPLAPNTTPAARARNRRVEFKILPNPAH